MLQGPHGARKFKFMLCSLLRYGSQKKKISGEQYRQQNDSCSWKCFVLKKNQALRLHSRTNICFLDHKISVGNYQPIAPRQGKTIFITGGSLSVCVVFHAVWLKSDSKVTHCMCDVT